MIKEYKTPQELIDELEKEKGFKKGTINQELFEEETYLDAFTPYCDFVALGRDPKTNKRYYEQEIDFEIFKSLSSIDSYISNALHSYIGAFEKRIRAFVIGELCSAMRNNGDPGCVDSSILGDYADGKTVLVLSASSDFSIWEQKFKTKYSSLSPNEQKMNIKNKKKLLSSQRKKAVRSLAECFGRSCEKPTPMAKHYAEKYSSVPAFVGMHTLSLGTTAVLFGILPRESQNRFWERYCRRKHTYSDYELTAFLGRLKRIVDIRNVINHYEPIFPTLCEIHSCSINSFLIIAARLKNNFYLSTVKRQMAIDKPTLPVVRTQYNHEKYDAILKIIATI